MSKGSKTRSASSGAPPPAAPPPVAAPDLQSTLNSLRAVRTQLYAMPAATVAAMSQADQIKYGDSLQQLDTDILKLETTQMQQVNQAFARQAPALQSASAKLQNDASALTDSVKVIQTVSSGLGLITNIVGLLS